MFSQQKDGLATGQAVASCVHVSAGKSYQTRTPGSLTLVLHHRAAMLLGDDNMVSGLRWLAHGEITTALQSRANNTVITSQW